MTRNNDAKTTYQTPPNLNRSLSSSNKACIYMFSNQAVNIMIKHRKIKSIILIRESLFRSARPSYLIVTCQQRYSQEH